MTIERIRAHCHLQPIQPFTIHLADGREIPVPHPDFVAFGPMGRTLLVYRPDESHHVVDLLLVTDMHVSSASSGNGNSTKTDDAK